MSLIDNLLDYLRGPEKRTAVVAKERLQIILAHERAGRGAATPDYLPALQEELLEVIAKYIHIDRQMIKVQLDKHGEYDVLELNITLPENQRVL
ncbi:MAG: cell division topological specificity factor MinE [Pseudomonadota bacterium]|nr:cell division topological specificity factor MinE [Gallionellaceae bacterium]MDO9227163.1 cell division topological specificity factor MinE [Pseudomonadota bacterium]MDP1904077.1 cell division topological specificity factor MinE [Pseudomonadota bacterium]MDP2354192.1 cell division topological specificity factor MinE [Pseudomonadota bacterium]